MSNLDLIQRNILDLLPEFPQKSEIFEEIHKGNVKIERIISSGQSTQEGEFYDQDINEVVLIIQGSAVLEIENQIYNLKTGDYLNIPAHTIHRVVSTDLDQFTIWLAVHY